MSSFNPRLTSSAQTLQQLGDHLRHYADVFHSTPDLSSRYAYHQVLEEAVLRVFQWFLTPELPSRFQASKYPLAGNLATALIVSLSSDPRVIAFRGRD